MEQVQTLLNDEEFVETVTPEDDLSRSPDQLRKVWEEVWQEFVPEELLTFVIEHGDAFELREFINHENPTLIKGAYYV